MDVDARGQGAVECEHVWRVTEIVIEVNAADVVSTCVKCGIPGFEAGQGRKPRPELPEIRWTTGER